MSEKWTLYVAVGAFFVVSGAEFADAEVITNGSFESATAGLPDGWTTTGNMQVTSSQGETDGVNALAFSFANLPSNGVLSQTFSTDVGAQYQLSFDFGKFSVNQPFQAARLDVDIFDGTGFGGAQLLNTAVVDATPGAGDPNSTDSAAVYSTRIFSFIAAGGTSTLRFTDVSDPQAGGGGFDAMLDNVSVTAVPEPSGLLFISIGATGVYCTSRRRRKSGALTF